MINSKAGRNFIPKYPLKNTSIFKFVGFWRMTNSLTNYLNSYADELAETARSYHMKTAMNGILLELNRN